MIHRSEIEIVLELTALSYIVFRANSFILAGATDRLVA